MSYATVTAPMRIQARKGSVAEQQYLRSALPGLAWPIPKAIAPGVSPRPFENPVFAAPSLDLVFKEILSVTGEPRIPVQFMYSNRVHGPEAPVEL